MGNVISRTKGPGSVTDRRRFLGNVIAAIQSVIGGALGVVFGGAILSPGFARRQETWLSAATLTDLPRDQPVPITLRVARRDGYAQVVDRRIIFLVRTGDEHVTALDSTCTHLGCRVSWNAEAQELRCPCHGGMYDRTGRVKAGPPPAPLTPFETRIDEGQVLVQI
jgi:Rieske Fe-S protein